MKLKNGKHVRVIHDISDVRTKDGKRERVINENEEMLVSQLEVPFCLCMF